MTNFQTNHVFRTSSYHYFSQNRYSGWNQWKHLYKSHVLYIHCVRVLLSLFGQNIDTRVQNFLICWDETRRSFCTGSYFLNVHHTQLTRSIIVYVYCRVTVSAHTFQLTVTGMVNTLYHSRKTHWMRLTECLWVTY